MRQLSKPGAPVRILRLPTMFNLRERLASQWATAKKQLLLVLLGVGVLWAVFLLQLALPESWVNFRAWGIRPRTPGGVLSIIAAPFIHLEFRRLFALTMPLLVLGWLLLLTDRRLLLRVLVVSAVTSGVGAWAFGRDEIISPGASGVLAGLLGFLVTRGWLARRLLWSLVALGVGLFYFGELLLLPFSSGVSWASHLWGFAGGIGLAWWMYGRSARKNKPASAVKPSDKRRQ